MMAKKLQPSKSDSTARSAKATKQSYMVAKTPSGDPMIPAASPTTTQPMGAVVPKSTGRTKKVAKVEKAKKTNSTGRKLNKPAVRKKVK